MSRHLNGNRVCRYVLLGLICASVGGAPSVRNGARIIPFFPGRNSELTPHSLTIIPETIGQSQRKKGSGSAGTDINIPSEAIVYLPEKKSIYRIVIHSTNLEAFELHAFNSRGEWDKIYDRRRNTDPMIDIRFNKAILTSGIKVVVRQTTDDAARRRENVQLRRENVQTADGNIRRGRYLYFITGPTTALANISEIALYGYDTGSP